MVNQDEQVYQSNKDVGASRYHLTQIETPTINRPAPNFEAQLKGVSGHVLHVIDWVWANFPGFPEKGFLESIVTPFSGNPASIRANGDAWEAVGREFAAMAGNLGANATTMLAIHWEGEAAERFGKFLRTYWKDGAAWAGEQLGKILRAGFDKVAEAADKIAKAVLAAVGKIVDIAIKLASRAMPLHTAWTVIEQLADLIGINVDSVYDDVQKILALWRSIETLSKKFEALLIAMQGYFKAFDQMLEAVRSIPTINDASDAGAMLEKLSSGQKSMNKHQRQITSTAKESREQLGKVNTQIGGISARLEE